METAFTRGTLRVPVFSMLWLVFIAATIVLGVAEPASEQDSASSSIYVQPSRHDLDYRHREDAHQGPDVRHEHSMDPVEEIIEHVNSPDYYQPTVVLDYRYMKTGGRDYVQGPGGQYLILPHNIRSNQPKKFRDFDALLDHLKQKRMNENSHRTL